MTHCKLFTSAQNDVLSFVLICQGDTRTAGTLFAGSRRKGAGSETGSGHVKEQEVSQTSIPCKGQISSKLVST